MCFHSKSLLCFCCVFLSVVLSGCSSFQKWSQEKNQHATNEVRIAATPKAEPHKTITNFTDSLRCMDSLFVTYGIRDLIIGAQDIPDATEVVIAGSKDMLISSLSVMSIKSRAVKFVALGQDLEDITRFHSLHSAKDFTSPDFFLRGAITQVDRGVLENQVSAGIAIKDYGISASADRISSIIALDLNMGLVSNLQILPGINSSNSIAVVRKGKGADLSGKIKSVGAVFQVDFTESEGLHHALRTLVELGSIEIMGKLTQVPYWECLDIETSNTYVQTQIEDWYKSLSKEDLVKFIQAKLIALDLYEGDIDGQESESLKSVIAFYKARQGLIADSKLNYTLYYKLISEPTPIHKEHEPLLTKVVEEKYGTAVGPTQEQKTIKKEVPQPLALESTRLTPLELSLSSNRGEKPIYKVGEDALIQASVSVDSYLYCYYQPNPEQIIKIYPNRFIRKSRILAGDTINVPADERFSIKMEQTGNREQILCMASYEDLEQKMPAELKSKSLQPVSQERLAKIYRRKVSSLTDIYGIYKSSAKVVPIKQQLTLRVQ